MSRGNRFRGFARKVFALFLVTAGLFAISVLTTAMVSTATFTPTEAGGIIDSIHPASRSNALWAFIIPAAFFLVLFSRGRNPETRKPHR